MIIQTRFDTKEKVWLIYDNEVRHLVVEKVLYVKDERNGDNEIQYTVNTEVTHSFSSLFFTVEEDKVFATKEELISSL